MAKKKFIRDSGSPFGGSETSTTEVDAALYGTVDIGKSGRVVAKPVDIMRIRADVRQPRRALPASVRGGWAGEADAVRDILAEWINTCALRGHEVDVLGAMRGVSAPDGAPVFVGAFYDLARLAGSIRADGLINPVTVRDDGQGLLVIETGERRWLAYHLLAMYAGEEWSKIPSVISTESGAVWRQATENTARRSLNAIQMARQLALLIMAAIEEARGEAVYPSFAEVVAGGVCDRRYYALVADGREHRVPSGYAERIEQAMGVGRNRLRHYRSLLAMTDDEALNDALWIRADEEDTAEGALRQLKDFNHDFLAEILSADAPLSSALSSAIAESDDESSVTAVTLGADESVTNVTLGDGNAEKFPLGARAFLREHPVIVVGVFGTAQRRVQLPDGGRPIVDVWQLSDMPVIASDNADSVGFGEARESAPHEVGDFAVAQPPRAPLPPTEPAKRYERALTDEELEHNETEQRENVAPYLRIYDSRLFDLKVFMDGVSRVVQRAGSVEDRQTVDLIYTLSPDMLARTLASGMDAAEAEQNVTAVADTVRWLINQHVMPLLDEWVRLAHDDIQRLSDD